MIYCKGWTLRRKFANQPYSEVEEKNLYQNRKPFGVVIERDNKPFCFIDFNNTFVYVGFLDEYQRLYLAYEFSEKQDNRLFLKDVYYWEFEKETDNKLNLTWYRFTPEGECGIENKNYQKREKVRRYAENKIDVSGLWENYPEFGKYDRIISIERDIPYNEINRK